MSVIRAGLMGATVPTQRQLEQRLEEEAADRHPGHARLRSASRYQKERAKQAVEDIYQTHFREFRGENR